MELVTSVMLSFPLYLHLFSYFFCLFLNAFSSVVMNEMRMMKKMKRILTQIQTGILTVNCRMMMNGSVRMKQMKLAKEETMLCTLRMIPDQMLVIDVF